MIGRSPGLRRPIVLATLTASLLCGGVTPAHAQSDARGVPADMIVAPGVDAIASHLPVRVAVRVPGNATRLRVRLGPARRDRPLQRRGRFAAGRPPHARRRPALWEEPSERPASGARGRRPLIHARGFSVVRHNAQLAQVRVRPGPVTSVNIRVAGAGRLTTIRRIRFARLWVNGRPAHRAIDHSLVTRYTAKLSATQGLRYGVNRLRVRVYEPDAGRYVEVRRRFRIKRNRHLASAGWDVDTRAGRFVQLDGRRSRTAGGGEPRPPLADPAQAAWLERQAAPRGQRPPLDHARPPRPLRRRAEGDRAQRASGRLARRCRRRPRRAGRGSRQAAPGLQGADAAERPERDPGRRELLPEQEPGRSLDAVADAAARHAPAGEPVRQQLARRLRRGRPRDPAAHAPLSRTRGRASS